MEKLLKYKRIILSFIVLIFITILSVWIYSKIEFIKALSKFSKIDSIHMEGTVTLFLDSYHLDLKGSANYADNILESKLTTDYVWNPISLELYAKIEEDNITFYLLNNLSNNCLDSVQEISSVKLKNRNFNLKGLKIKKVKSDRANEKKYKVVLSKKKFYSLVLNKELDNLDDEDITLYFYIKNGEVTGISALEEKIYISKEKNIYLSNFNLTFSNWNDVSDIFIPKNRVEECKDIDKDLIKELFF